MEYFNEAIFDPLFGLLEELGVPENDPERYNAAGDWAPFDRALGSLGIRRPAMPQVRMADHDDLFAHLRSLGVLAKEQTVKAKSLRPSQRDYSPSKIQSAWNFDSDDVVLVSADGYVADGHHRWFARYLTDRDVRVVRFDEEIRPLISHIRTFAESYRENAKGDVLARALDGGKLWYADGAFYGSFSPAVARRLRELGATFDEGSHSFRLASDKVPMETRIALQQSIDRAKNVSTKVAEFLVAAEANLKIGLSLVDMKTALATIERDLEEQWTHATVGIDFVELKPDFTPAIRETIAKDFTNNLDLYVRNFLDHEIPEMREVVAQNAFAGYRADRLAKELGARYGVTKRKAAFLADQETSLLVSKYRQAKAESIGATTYEWSTSHDERVRPDHRLLNGKIFAFTSPPVTNLKTGARNNPGEDFRCRCVAMAIIQILDEVHAPADRERRAHPRADRVA